VTQLDLAAPRNHILDVHAKHRAALISVADRIARELAANGPVCMPRVLRAMREQGYAAMLEGVDPRWTGAVLLPSRGWQRTGELVREGSRARPVPMWRRR
jgi:hypothetical protein